MKQELKPGGKPHPEIVKPHEPGQEHATPDERIDEAIDESFPASDPPSWNSGAKNDAVPDDIDRPHKPGG
jgi:hypothetical protein